MLLSEVLKGVLCNSWFKGKLLLLLLYINKYIINKYIIILLNNVNRFLIENFMLHIDVVKLGKYKIVIIYHIKI